MSVFNIGRSKFSNLRTYYACWMRNLVTSTHSDGVTRIKLNNSKKRNALSLEVLKVLKKNLLECADDPAVRCIILSAEGPVFSSGHDLKELANSSGDQRQEIFSSCSDVMLSIKNLPIPVIAQVEGMAAAAGFQLVASCDIVVASEKAQFSVPGANIGLFCSTPGVAVARALPQKLATYLLVTGLPLTATEAYQCGFVSRVVPEESLEDETATVVKSILSKSRSVIKMGKSFLYKQIEMDVQTAYRAGEKVMVDNLEMVDSQEGIKAFFDKRRPQWTHTESNNK